MKITSIFIFFLLSCCPLAQGQAPERGWPFLHEQEDATYILLMGDNNFQHREQPEEAFKYLMPTLKQADLRMLNLEGPFAGGTNNPDKSDIPHKDWRHSDPDQVAALTAAGIDAVGVANNVTYPWQALMRSLEVLEEAGVRYAGGGKNIAEAHQPVIFEKNGVRIGFMQYASTVYPTNHAATEHQPGIAEIRVHTAYQPPPNLDKPGQPPIVITWMDEASKQRMVEDIQKLKEKTDVVIVSYHWGVSGTYQAVSYQTEIAQTVIDAGADLVFGHGPHKYQGIELYKGKPILYSLGQGVFDDRRDNGRGLRNREGLLARVIVRDKRIRGVSLVPTWREDDQFIRLYDPNEGKGRELFGYLQTVNVDGAGLKLVGKEIAIQGIE